MRLSARNQIPARVTGINSGEAIANVELDAGGVRLVASVTVEAVQLGKLVTEHGFEKFSLVCDIEGKEYDLVCQEIEVLKKADVIIMETHARLIGEDKNQSLLRALTDGGFRIIEEDSFVVTLQRSADTRAE